MVRTTREGKVYAEVGEVDVTLGSVEKDPDLGWKGDCELCEHISYQDTKSAAVDELETHFLSDHTSAPV